MGKNENGYITVETLGTFLPFVLLVVSILSLVNIVTAQTRVHYALTQTANAISVYGLERSEESIRELMERYLSNGDQSGGEYLKSANVTGGLAGLEFNTGLASADGEVFLSVGYEIEYKFGALLLPFGPRLKVAQQAKTKAWQGGAGEGYAG